jgi:hypothetical protein
MHWKDVAQSHYGKGSGTKVRRNTSIFVYNLGVTSFPRYQYAGVNTYTNYEAPNNQLTGRESSKVNAIMTLMGSISVLMPHVKATPRYLHGTSINKKTKNMKSQMKEEQTNELMERQNHAESDDAETAPGFLEGDIAIPEVN